MINHKWSHLVSIFPINVPWLVMSQSWVPHTQDDCAGVPPECNQPEPTSPFIFVRLSLSLSEISRIRSWWIPKQCRLLSFPFSSFILMLRNFQTKTKITFSLDLIGGFGWRPWEEAPIACSVRFTTFSLDELHQWGLVFLWMMFYYCDWCIEKRWNGAIKQLPLWLIDERFNRCTTYFERESSQFCAGFSSSARGQKDMRTYIFKVAHLKCKFLFNLRGYLEAVVATTFTHMDICRYYSRSS